MTCKVLHLLTGDLWAGAEVVTYELLAELVKYNDIKLYAVVFNQGVLADKIKALGIQTYVFSEQDSLYRQFINIYKAVKGLNIDIIHSHKFKEDFISVLLSMLCKIPYLIRTIHSLHGITKTHTGFKYYKSKLFSFINWFILKIFFNRIIAVSEDIKKHYAKLYLDKKLVVVRNAINVEKVYPAKLKEEIKQELSLDKDSFVIGSAGRLVPIKGYDVFLKMAKIILDRNPNVVFVLVGDGPLLGDLKALAGSLGITNSVRFIGYKNDIYNYLNMMDIFVLASLSEGIPSIILEAAALKIPIVSTAVGGIPEILKDNVSARLVQAGDEKLLAQVCMGLVDDYKYAKKLADTAKNNILENFDIKKTVYKIKEVYSSLLE